MSFLVTFTQRANSAGIPAGSLPLTTLATISNNRILGNVSGNLASPSAVTIDQVLPTTTKGDIIVHNGTTNTRQAVGLDGNILIADSNSSTGRRSGPQMPNRNAYTSGRYYGPFNVSAYTAKPISSNTLYAVRIPVYKRQAFTAIGAWFTAGASNNVRYGLYTDSGGLPVSLLLDAGAMTITNAAQNDVTISLTLDADYVWAVLVTNASATVNATGNTSFDYGVSSCNTFAPWLTASFTYGTLPSTFPASSYSDGNTSPFIALKV